MTESDREARRRIEEIGAHPWRQRIGDELRVGRGPAIPIIDPTDDTVLVAPPTADADDVRDAVDRAADGAVAWGAATPRERAGAVRDFAAVLERHAEELAWLDTIDAGLPLWMMRIDAATGVERMRLFADLAHSLVGQTIPASAGNLHLTFPEPFGVVARIIPFNHPFMFASSKLAAPLVAGNAVVLKPSELTPLSALRMGELADGVLPPGVFSVVHGGPETGEALVRHPAVSRIAFTGSHQVGRAIQRSGAEVGIKHVSLELGGKNALLLFPDADLDRALASAVKGMNFAFAGQSCGSTSRVLVHESIAEEFTERFVRAVAGLRLGRPWEEGVQIGPMVSRRQQDRALGFIERAVAAGAEVLTGGSRGPGDGYAVQPTVLGGVTPDLEVAREEVFGPVVSIMTFREETEAVRIANGVEYGLTGSVWTRDLDRALRVSRALEAGYVWINDTSTHFPGVPFGGIKLSGIGREESVDELLSYTQLRAINVVTA